jgi:predicted ATP-grasp superfamily ATP-dependent carboligase
MAKILLTGGRAPATLELARMFYSVGHQVFLAESVRSCLTSASRALTASFLIPPPRQQPKEFLQALLEIIRQNQIDLLIPTCEEAFHIARKHAVLSDYCTVFIEPLEKLRPLHHKAAFIQLSQDLALPVPESCLVETPDQLSKAFARWPRLVLKPVYSRFATSALILPSREQAETVLRLKAPTAWVAQEYVAGNQVCTYSIAHQGHLTAHCAYRSGFTAGMGSTILFQPLEQPAALAWVRQFVAARQFTGQISFDFIETAAGDVWAIECNPRATSGVHLFAKQTAFPETFFNPQLPCLFPSPSTSSMLLTAMLVYGLPAALRNQALKHWLLEFTHSRDVIFSFSDPAPALLQMRSLLHFVLLGWRRGLSPLEASTYDIEWNGE